MEKCGTLASIHRAGEMCPSHGVLGITVCAHLRFLTRDKLLEFKLYPELYCVLLWSLSSRPELDASLFTYHLSHLGVPVTLKICLPFRSHSDRCGSGAPAVQNSQSSHIAKLAPSCQSFLLPWSHFRPSSEHSRYAAVHLASHSLPCPELRTSAAQPRCLSLTPAENRGGA